MDESENIKFDKTTFYFLFFFAIAALACILICSLYGAFYYPKNVFANNYPTLTQVGYSAEYLGTVTRKKPEVSDGGLSRYPRYGYSLTNPTASEAERQALINESWNLCSTTTRIGSDGYPKGTYNSMDSDGNLYLNGAETGRKLYKHSASVDMYFGNISDSEPGVVKKITMRSNNAGYNITGLYAAPGEVIKIEMSEADLALTGGLRVFIGQALYNSKANNIWLQKGVMNRMPIILNTLDVKDGTTGSKKENGTYTAYVGSYMGGPIYVQPIKNNGQFSVTISGAVNYSHFILGYTTREEFEQNAKSSTPFFDLLVWEKGVLHSGPKSQADGLSYDDLYNVAVYWDKVAQVSTAMKGSNGIAFLYDPFVAAGAAVAFPGQGAVNCPVGWMRSSLSYNTLINSGAWGNMHEYNHNFQGWGCSFRDGEVTNNALTLVEYSLFTKISANRKLGVGGDGMSGWNCYTSAPWALNLVLSGNINSTNGLAVYSTLNHNFGQDAFIKSRAGGGVSGYLGKWGEVTHHNFTYYASLISNYTDEGGLSNAVSEAQKDYPAFVPISTIYQTGRSYNYDGEKRYIETMQPYKITYGQNFKVDLTPYTLNSDNHYESGSVVLPEGFSYNVKNITQPQYGKLTKTNEGIYTYSPDKRQMKSGKIYVTIEITRDKNVELPAGIEWYDNWKIDDVDLVLEFEQTHEFNKNILERTIYTYSDDNMYKYNASNADVNPAIVAYENNFKGYSNKIEEDNINPTQNSNTDIWVPNPNNNTIMEITGKLQVPTNGKYRLSLRGRNHAALYYSLDGVNYHLAGEINDAKQVNGSANFRNNDEKTYVDIIKDKNGNEDLKAGQWVYIKEILVVDYASAYIGVGFTRWTDVYENIEIGGEITNALVRTEPPTSISYATGYRSSYELPNNKFETNYFIEREYTATYSNSYSEEQSNVKILESSPCGTNSPIEFAFDDNLKNGVISSKLVSDENFVFAVDMGETIKANTFTFYGYQQGGTNYVPISFDLYSGTKQDKLELIGSFSDLQVKSNNTSVTFKTRDVRYFKVIVTDMPLHRYVAFAGAKFSHNFSGTLLSPDNGMFKFSGNWQIANKYSTFGHVYNGKHASVDFSFYGTEFAIYSNQSGEYGDFEVIIDGQAAEKVSAKNNGNSTGVTYISNELEEKMHNVTIRSKNLFNIDSIAIKFSDGSEKHVLSASAIVAIVIGSLAAISVILLIVLILVKKPTNKVATASDNDGEEQVSEIKPKQIENKNETQKNKPAKRNAKSKQNKNEQK